MSAPPPPVVTGWPEVPLAPGEARAALGLGSNLGDGRALIAAALALLARGGARPLARSADHATVPWGVADQPPFVNACALVATRLPPRALLDLCLAAEAALGRERRERWGPRRIDVDLLAYEAEARDEPGLSLPHPRLLERAFVVVPLAEVAPRLVVRGASVAAAARAAPPGAARRLD